MQPMKHLSTSRRSSARLGAALLAALAAVTASERSLAQPMSCAPDSALPCGYGIVAHSASEVPRQLKLQARLSQAQRPVMKETFTTVLVNVLSGTERLCSERLSEQKVVDGVLNLTLGTGRGCPLDELVAAHAALAFEICLETADNCLQPVELGTVPYAMKSSTTSLAERAEIANDAIQSNYARRATADRDLLLTRELGTGYFDFATPPAGSQGPLYPGSSYTPYRDTGFLSWVPLRPGQKNLHLLGQSEDAGRYVDLRRLVLASDATEAKGTLDVGGRMTVRGGGLAIPQDSLEVTGDSTVRGALQTSEQTRIDEELTVLGGGIDVTDGLLVRVGGLEVEGSSDLASTLAVRGDANLGATLGVAGDARVGGALSVTGATAFSGGILGTVSIHGGGLDVEGAAEFDSVATFTGGVTIAGRPGPIPNVTTSDGARTYLYVNRLAAPEAPTSGDFDVLSLSGRQGLHLSGGAGVVTLESASQVGAGLTVEGATTVAGTLSAASVTVGGQAVPAAHEHPYASASHLHDDTLALRSHEHAYAAATHAHVGEFADSSHTHQGLAHTSHEHGGFSPSAHSHGEAAGANHTHVAYASSLHGHDFASPGHAHDYAVTGHTHESGGGGGAGRKLGACLVFKGTVGANVGSDNGDDYYNNRLDRLDVTCPDTHPVLMGWDFNGSGNDMWIDADCCKLEAE